MAMEEEENSGVSMMQQSGKEDPNIYAVAGNCQLGQLLLLYEYLEGSRGLESLLLLFLHQQHYRAKYMVKIW